MFELKLTFSTADDLYAAVAKLAGEAVAAPVAVPLTEAGNIIIAEGAECVVRGPSGEKKKPSRPRKAAEPEVTSSATGAADQDPAPVAAPLTPTGIINKAIEAIGDAHLQTDAFPATAPDVIPTHDDVTKAAQAVNAKVGLAKLKTLLAEFSAARVSEVKVEDRVGFIKRAKELCA